MKSTREKILRTLLANPKSSINHLAETVGINGISIRHHLTALEAENLVVSSEERHGVGRPRLVYSLTDKGIELFPTSYLKLTKRILESLKEKMTSEEITQIFKEIGADIARTHEAELNGLPLEKRLELLKKILTKEGFIVDLISENDGYTLKSLSCPYLRIGMEHPEICALDVNLISAFLSSPVSVETCIFDNDNCCTYVIPMDVEMDEYVK